MTVANRVASARAIAHGSARGPRGNGSPTRAGCSRPPSLRPRARSPAGGEPHSGRIAWRRLRNLILDSAASPPDRPVRSGEDRRPAKAAAPSHADRTPPSSCTPEGREARSRRSSARSRNRGSDQAKGCRVGLGLVPWNKFASQRWCSSRTGVFAAVRRTMAVTIDSGSSALGRRLTRPGNPHPDKSITSLRQHRRCATTHRSLLVTWPSRKEVER